MMMLKESNNPTVIRIFMHRAFPNLMMVKFSDDPVNRTANASDAILLYNSDSALIGVNLLRVPFQKNGYVALDESLKCYILDRFSDLNIDIDIDQKPTFVCGRIEKFDAHPMLTHVNVCTVDIGEKDVSIVCSAKNIRKDMLVVVALPNSVLPDGTLITQSQVAGIMSHGMLCSLSEITGGKKPVKGLIDLPKDTECGSVLDIAGLGETLC
jgi:tRNA-binding protein